MTFGSMADEAASRLVMDRAWDAGVDFLDVAETYRSPARSSTRWADG